MASECFAQEIGNEFICFLDFRSFSVFLGPGRKGIKKNEGLLIFTFSYVSKKKNQKKGIYNINNEREEKSVSVIPQLSVAISKDFETPHTLSDVVFGLAIIK
jgi:hypothetical protein